MTLLCYYYVMEYAIRIVDEADDELRRIPVYYRRKIVKGIVSFLSHEPARQSRSRIKRLRQPATSVFRLRIGDYRVFYDVSDDTVTVLRVCHKSDCAALCNRKTK